MLSKIALVYSLCLVSRDQLYNYNMSKIMISWKLKICDAIYTLKCDPKKSEMSVLMREN